MSNSERNYQKEFENAPLLKERINGIRHDHKGKFLAFGEIIDNGFDWGKATEIDIYFDDGEIYICDNGLGIRQDLMPKILQFGANRELPDYCIGKFHVGLKEGSIIISNCLDVYSRYEGVDMHVQANWNDMKKRNTYIPTIESQQATTSIKQQFRAYCNLFTKDSGTCIKLSNLNGFETNAINYKLLIDYLTTLYAHGTKLKINTYFKNEVSESRIIEFRDHTMYDDVTLDKQGLDGASTRDINHYHIYSIDDEKYIIQENIRTHTKKFLERKTNNDSPKLKDVIKIEGDTYSITNFEKYYQRELIHKVNVIGSILSKKEQKQQNDLRLSKPHRGGINNGAKGFKFYRQDRNVSGSRSLFIEDWVSMKSRADGVRISVYFKANIGEKDDASRNTDGDFGVSQLKLITTSSIMDGAQYVHNICEWEGRYWSNLYDDYLYNGKVDLYGPLEKFFTPIDEKWKEINITEINCFEELENLQAELKKKNLSLNLL